MVSELHELQPGLRDFEKRGVVGRGRFAEVQVVRERSTGDVCALKVMEKAGLRSKENVSYTIFHSAPKIAIRCGGGSSLPCKS